jgi:hypothetical protein
MYVQPICIRNKEQISEDVLRERVAELRTIAVDLARRADPGFAAARIKIRHARGRSAGDVTRWADFDSFGQPAIATRRAALLAVWDEQRRECTERLTGIPCRRRIDDGAKNWKVYLARKPLRAWTAIIVKNDPPRLSGERLDR